jgi:hypothetical protein
MKKEQGTAPAETLIWFNYEYIPVGKHFGQYLRPISEIKE